MPGQRLPMRKIRDVLRLRAGGMSKRKIAASLSIGVTAAGECVRRARRAGLIWPLPGTSAMRRWNCVCTRRRRPRRRIGDRSRTGQRSIASFAGRA